MNLQNYYYDNFIDAKNEFIGGGGGGETNNIIISGSDSDTLNKYFFISSNNLYIANSNINGEIRLKTLFNYANNSDDYGTKIDQTGRILVYHNYDITKPLVAAGFLNVESELAGLKQSSFVSDAEILIVQGQIAGIDENLASQLLLISELETEVSIHRAILYEDADNYNFFRNIIENDENLNINIANQQAQAIQTKNNSITYGILTGVGLAGLAGYVSSFYNFFELKSLSNMYSNVSNGYITDEARLETTSNFSYYEKENIINMNNNLSNLNINNGFINSNITTSQFIPTIKSNKIMLGNITTPNQSFQMEMTGDLNLNMLYLNSTSLTSLLNQKQGNLTFNNPLLNTTNTISLKRDSSLTLNGSGQLSVVRTATTPIIITGNDFSLSYDASLTKIGNSLSVVKTATTPIIITGNNFSLNYDSTLTLNGNQLSVTGNSASKWLQSGNNIYNINIGNVGIGTTIPEQILHLHRNLTNAKTQIKFTNGDTGVGGFRGGYIGLGGDSNFYIQYLEDGDIRFSTNNTERLRINNNGNIGIGDLITTPESIFEIKTKKINYSPTAWFFTYKSMEQDIMENYTFTNNNVGINSDGVDVNRSANFNGTNARIYSATNFGINAISFTICFWINKSSSGQQRYLFELGNIYGGVGDRMFISFTTDNRMRVAFDLINPIDTSIFNDDLDTWVHYSLVYTKDIYNFKIYRNGVLDVDTYIPTNTTTNFSAFTSIGGSTIVNSYFWGRLYDFRIYRYALSAYQIGVIYKYKNSFGGLCLNSSEIFNNRLNICHYPIANNRFGYKFHLNNQTIKKDIIYIDDNGFIGIGKTPGQPLDIDGNVILRGINEFRRNINDINYVYISNYDTNTSAGAGFYLNTATNSSIFTKYNANHPTYPSELHIFNDAVNSDIFIKAGRNIIYNTNNTNRLIITQTGTIGINTNSPNTLYKLDVVGAAKLGDVIITQTGTIGINTNSPNTIYKLDVVGAAKLGDVIIESPVNPTTTGGLRFLKGDGSADGYGMIDFVNGNQIISATLGKESGSYDKYLYFYFSPSYCKGLHSTGNLVNDGFVSISGGAVNADYPLYVGAGTNTTLTYSKAIYHGFHPTSGLPYQTPVYTNTNINFSRISIFAVDSILTQKWFAAVSDERIKNDIIPLNNALDIINKFKVVNFKYKDFINKGNANNYGFIAQDVKKIIPDIVSEIKDFIPNIYKKCHLNKNIIYIDDADLVIGDKIKIIDDIKFNEIICNVIERNNILIKIDKEIVGKYCFIYGKEVNDYLSLSKEHIFAINVKATQELSKKIDDIYEILKRNGIK